MLARHSTHLTRASLVACLSTERYRHGVVIAKGNRVLSVGVNSNRNVPLNCSDPKRQAGIHAEVAAIKGLPKGIDYSRLTLYSARVTKTGEPAMAKPCENCQTLIDILGFRDVFWTGDENGHY